MKPETLLSSLGKLDEDILIASEQPVMKKPRRVGVWLATAAALAVAAGIGYLGWRTLTAGTAQNLPLAEPSAQTEPNQQAETTGLSEYENWRTEPALLPESISLFDENGEPLISTEPTEADPASAERELPLLKADPNTPQTMLPESRLMAHLEQISLLQPDDDTLPVFEKANPDQVLTLSPEQMIELLETTMDSLGIPYPMPLEYNLPILQGGETVSSLSYPAENGITVNVTKTGRVTLEYSEQARLPVPEDISGQAALREHYIEEYFNLLFVPYHEAWELDVQSTMAAVDPRYQAGRKTTEAEEEFLSNTLRDVVMTLDETGRLVNISYDGCFRTEYLPLGDYPIMSRDEAYSKVRERLSWTTTTNLPDTAESRLDEDLCELTYLLPIRDPEVKTPYPPDQLIPYYIFWCKTDDTADGEPVYSAIYQPAIRASYFQQ